MPAFEPVTGRYLPIDIDGTTYRVYVEMAGQGIPLILQHTAGADGRQWRHLLNDEAVGRDFLMIAADLPRHGKSLPAEGSRWWAQEYRLSRDFFMRFQVRLAEVLGCERPVYMGCSIGGHLALDLALDYPGFFRAVIGLEASDYTPSASLDQLDNPRVGNQYAATLMYGLTSPRSPEERRRECAWVYSQAAPGIFRGDLEYYTVGHNLAGRGPEIDTAKTAVYVLTGTYDWSATDAASEAFAKTIPGASFTRMEGLGHFPMAEDPVRFGEYLMPVLKEIVARG